MSIHNYKIIILEKHLDTFGHVNNAKYLELYEEARWDIITSKGFGLDRIKKDKMGPVIVNINLTFAKEINNRETITIRTEKQENIRPMIMRLKQEMIKEDGSIANTAIIDFGIMDLKQRKLIRSGEWMEMLD